MRHPSAHARKTPDKAALIMAGSGERLSYAELDAASNRGAQALRSLGVGQGDGIAMLFENRLDFMELCWSCQRSGVFYTAISTHLTVPEIAYIMRDCGAKIAVLSDRFADMLPEIEAECPGLRVFVSGGAARAERDWRALCATMPSTPVPDEAAGTDVLYSSGTTGRPKGITRAFVPEPIDTVPAVLTVLCEQMGAMGPDTVYLSPAPLYHAAPLRFSMMVVSLGGTVVIMEKFDAAGMLDAIGRFAITHSQVVPTMFVRLLRLPEETRAAADLSSLRLCYHAAAPCPQEVKARMIDWWGPILVEYYAGSEANGVTVATSADWLAHPGTVGRALIGRIAVLDGDGADLPPGETGDIYFDTGLSFEYRNDPEKTANAFARPGCSTLGDVGHVDEEGFLFLTDRAAYTIISGGVNIYPQETEDTLICHPDVADCAVFGVPNEEMGEEVKAVVQLEAGVSSGPDKEAELIAWCRARLSGVKAPKSIDFRTDLPRTPTGKMIKRKLKDEYWAKARA